MSRSHLREAFRTVIPDAAPRETWYVALMESRPYYGGPEEGGWWGSDTLVVEVKEFPTEAHARSVMARVEAEAKRLSAESRTAFGNQCLNEMEFLEAHGLDADYLREPDGESSYTVRLSKDYPEEYRGARGYS